MEKYISNTTGVLMMKGKAFLVNKDDEICCTKEEFEPSKAVRIEVEEEKEIKKTKKTKKVDKDGE